MSFTVFGSLIGEISAGISVIRDFAHRVFSTVQIDGLHLDQVYDALEWSSRRRSEAGIANRLGPGDA